MHIDSTDKANPDMDRVYALFVLYLLVKLVFSAEESWTLSLIDNFDGPSLNTSLWNVKNNQSHCCQLGKQELQLYIAEQVFVKNGFLNIQTRFNRKGVFGPEHKRFNFTSTTTATP